MTAIRHIVCYSGGETSALVALEVVKRYGTEGVVLLNHDINPWVEDADIKRFKDEIADLLGLPVTYANIGGITDPAQIPDQFDVCMAAKAFKVGMGTELCTNRLKTGPFLDWLKANVPDPSAVVCYYGFEPKETDRIERRRSILGELGYRTAFPLAEWGATLQGTHEVGVPRPVTYDEGWKHANCKGCLKAGKQHWYCVYVKRRDIYNKAKFSEVYIGYTIHRGESLASLEEDFEIMRQAGIPADERIPSGQFWAMARKAIKAAKPLGALFADLVIVGETPCSTM